jgi:hypothetical protein
VSEHEHTMSEKGAAIVVAIPLPSYEHTVKKRHDNQMVALVM